MDIVHSKPNLVRSPRPAEIFRKLNSRGVRIAGSCRAAEKSERPRHAAESKLRVIGWVVQAFYSHVAPGEKIVREGLDVDRAQQRCAESADHARTHQIRIAQSERVSPSHVVRNTHGKHILAIVVAWGIQTRELVTAKQGILLTL